MVILLLWATFELISCLDVAMIKSLIFYLLWTYWLKKNGFSGTKGVGNSGLGKRENPGGIAVAKLQRKI